MSFVESILKHDRGVVVGVLAAVTALAWLYVWHLSIGMGMTAMDMPGWRMLANGMDMLMVPDDQAWTMREFALTLVMWIVMMVGMMTPSAAPLALVYARAAKTTRATHAFVATGWLVLGYLLVWTAFALAATSVQFALDRTGWLGWDLRAAPWAASAVLMIAGVYQWTPLKHACLATCQAPVAFIEGAGGFRRDAAGALSTGLQQGAYCVGCCWALMALLFVGGVMNLTWIALLAAFALIEKLAPIGPWFSRAVGALLILAALALL